MRALNLIASVCLLSACAGGGGGVFLPFMAGEPGVWRIEELDRTTIDISRCRQPEPPEGFMPAEEVYISTVGATWQKGNRMQVKRRGGSVLMSGEFLSNGLLVERHVDQETDDRSMLYVVEREVEGRLHTPRRMSWTDRRWGWCEPKTEGACTIVDDYTLDCDVVLEREAIFLGATWEEADANAALLDE